LEALIWSSGEYRVLAASPPQWRHSVSAGLDCPRTKAAARISSAANPFAILRSFPEVMPRRIVGNEGTVPEFLSEEKFRDVPLKWAADHMAIDHASRRGAEDVLATTVRMLML